MNYMHTIPIKLSLLAMSTAAFFATGCEPPLYHPYKDGSGYTEKLISGDTAEVTYFAGRPMPQSEASFLAMLRAAEVTRDLGHTHFVVESERTHASGRIRTGEGDIDYRGPGTERVPDIEIDSPWLSVRSVPAVTLTVTMLSANEAESNPKAFDSQQIVKMGAEKGYLR